MFYCSTCAFQHTMAKKLKACPSDYSRLLIFWLKIFFFIRHILIMVSPLLAPLRFLKLLNEGITKLVKLAQRVTSKALVFRGIFQRRNVRRHISGSCEVMVARMLPYHCDQPQVLLVGCLPAAGSLLSALFRDWLGWSQFVIHTCLHPVPASPVGIRAKLLPTARISQGLSILPYCRPQI